VVGSIEGHGNNGAPVLHPQDEETPQARGRIGSGDASRVPSALRDDFLQDFLSDDDLLVEEADELQVDSRTTLSPSKSRKKRAVSATMETIAEEQTGRVALTLGTGEQEDGDGLVSTGKRPNCAAQGSFQRSSSSRSKTNNIEEVIFTGRLSQFWPFLCARARLQQAVDEIQAFLNDSKKSMVEDKDIGGTAS
ncbi:unnamed protein product, partial [Amoebophrya sp. A25]